MHIEPEIVDAAKIGLSYATASGALLASAKLSYDNIKENNLISFLIKVIASTLLVFTFFQVLPHYPVGVSEVHLIMGSTLFLLFGAAPAAIGLALGLLTQGLFFAPFDLPQFGMNVTSIIMPLIAISYLAKKVIPQDTTYTQLKYSQVLKLSMTYQAGIVAWVSFWAFYGQGFGAENLASVLSFGGAYMLVITIEPLVDLAVLAFAKSIKDTLSKSNLIEKRLYNKA
ncbi:energy-coupling factor ABC transporter permease [Sulfurimonas sp.]|uniref:energy-coupling factor ABC transporter permease n=1 Tax=Sulfurimonas sp. TaxID=2022749 RepID=UPI0025E2BEB5|nr:energy-coupling factor ABC transporter permease [Sulfurimonas sp.]